MITLIAYMSLVLLTVCGVAGIIIYMDYLQAGEEARQWLEEQYVRDEPEEGKERIKPRV